MGLKVYLYTDLEGIAWVDRWDDRKSQHHMTARRHRQMRELFMGEINAAADGAYAGGATAVVLSQGHADSAIYEMADERLEIIKGGGPTWLSGLDASFDAAFFVGAHAMAATPGATLCHTFNHGTRKRWWLCDQEIGELGAFAAITGGHGVPVVLATGDDKLCAEASRLIPEVETAQVKTGIDLLCAQHLSKERAREQVRMAALRAAERALRKEIPAFKPASGPPYRCRVRTRIRRFHLPAERPGEKWLSPYEVEYSSDDLLELMRRVTY
ncbi:MAG: M55 family metallopeptidase [Planctomycetota bacterium]|jgi:D-amino peptidase